MGIEVRPKCALTYAEWRAMCTSELGDLAARAGLKDAHDMTAKTGVPQLVRAGARSYVTKKTGASVSLDQYYRILDTLQLFDEISVAKRKYGRSYIQKQIHRNYINACLDIIWRGSWDRYQAVAMSVAGVTTIDKKIAVAMPRRFGKSVGIGQFVATMLWNLRDTGVTITVYSDGKRASDNLALIVKRYLLQIPGVRDEIKVWNVDEVVLRAGDGWPDRRLVSLPCPKNVRTHTRTHLSPVRT